MLNQQGIAVRVGHHCAMPLHQRYGLNLTIRASFYLYNSLAEITRIYQLSAARCFAMGDGHNDLEMLDPANAGMTACPANAVAVIREKIAANGGLVTRAPHADGVIEALEHYFPS